MGIHRRCRAICTPWTLGQAGTVTVPPLTLENYTVSSEH